MGGAGYCMDDQYIGARLALRVRCGGGVAPDWTFEVQFIEIIGDYNWMSFWFQFNEVCKKRKMHINKSIGHSKFSNT